MFVSGHPTSLRQKDVTLLPYNSDDELDIELEEIKRLLGESPAQPPDIFEESEIQVSGPPAIRKSPEAPQKKQVTGPPAVRKTAGPPQKRQSYSPPAVRERSAPTQPDKLPDSTAAPRNRAFPPQAKRPALSADTGDIKEIRYYDISSTGKITRSREKEEEPDAGSEEFEVDFDFEEAYRDVPEDRPLRRRREKRTGCIGGIMYATFVICVSIVLASLVWMAATDILGFGSDDEQVNIAIQNGFEIEDVTDMLYDAGLIRYKFLFNIYAGFSNAEEKIMAGTYVLNKNFDYRAIVQGMTARAGVRVETTVTIPEGYTMAQIFALLEDYGVCPAADLWEAATNHNFSFDFLDRDTIGERLRLEGFLFPETYNFFLGSTPVSVINRFLNEFNRRFSDIYIERAEAMGYSIRDIINVAAMIEREAGSDEERPRIAAVIYNRLNNPGNYPHLEIDATIRYAIAGTGRQFSVELEDPYNTYIHEGLPPGPISSPGMSSIQAALYPDSTNEYFYALNKHGTHNFFRTYNDHQRFVQSDEYGG